MSTANGATNKEDTFLQHVSLKNYKSIKDVEIDFKPGLNIIIGKNASGKTNFINALNNVLSLKREAFSNFEYNIKAYLNSKRLEIQVQNRIENFEDAFSNEIHNYTKNQDFSLKINNKKMKVAGINDIWSHMLGNGVTFNELVIKYGVNYEETTPLIGIPISFLIVSNDKPSFDLIDVIRDNNKTQFLRTFVFSLVFGKAYLLSHTEVKDGITKVKKGFGNQDFKSNIISFSEQHFKNINNLLSMYSPIQAIRINPDFNIVTQDNGDKQTVTNFYLEFLIDQVWLTFNLLSDGTKRLFYIISEMLADFNSDDDLITGEDIKIVLLEEPELGIHPHQLHQLMQFIKEQSKEKQIILTTHSPQVLDSLDSDELDRIIICHSEPITGTQLHHFSEQQIKKAKKYMTSEAFLSDYWRFSDLEPAS